MTPKKTPEQLIEDFKNGVPWFIDATPKPPDYHQMALLAAQTLPNQSAAELLASADKIEAWLRKPTEEMANFFMQSGPTTAWINQKSPEKIIPEASDGASGD